MVFGGRALRWFVGFFVCFGLCFGFCCCCYCCFKEQSQSVFMALGRKYVVGYNAISTGKKRKICRTDGY